MNNILSKENIEKSKINLQTEFIKDISKKRLLTLACMILSFSLVLAILIQLVFYVRYEAIILLSATLIFLIINTIRFSRWFYLSVMGDRVYYKASIAIHLICATVNILCYLFIPNMIYSWFFLLPKFLKFIIPGSSDILSIVIFYCLLLLTALISTSSVKWIVSEEKNRPEIEINQKL